MSTSVLENHLFELRMPGIRQNLEVRLQQARKNNLPYEELLSLIFQDESDYRRSAKIERLIKRAAFRQAASLESIDFQQSRGLDKKQISDFQTCRYIDSGLNIIIMGPTGVGKTYLATALGNAACRKGKSVLFFRMNSLVEQMHLSRAKGLYLNFLKRMARCDLLILDDFGIKKLDPNEYQDLFDVIDERGEEKSTVVTTQLPVPNWSEVIDDPVTCEALTDRLSASAITLVMKGDSYRKKRGLRRKPIDKD